MIHWYRRARYSLLYACLLVSPCVQAQASLLAPGFLTRSAASKLVVVPPDIELFSIGGGGVREPRADWTQAAQENIRAELAARQQQLGSPVQVLEMRDMDSLAELNALHGAVAQAIFLHHVLGGALKLPTKNGALDWSIGEAVQPLQQQSGADYALFIWIRDSYATAERKAAMVAMAFLGVGLAGGAQIGYASLVDLQTGRIVWFKDLRRSSGDLRQAGPAAETVETLLKDFPTKP
jgi:hypothetical protein